ncbi:MAG: glycosyltransferase family 1 protein [bacterium]
MHIAIDARFYGPFGKGLGRYVQKLIASLELLPHDHRFTVLLRDENWGCYTPSDARFTKIRANFPWYSLAEQTRFPRLLYHGKFDLVHFPHYNVPLLYRRPFVVTIHDLIVSRYPTVRATTLNPMLYRLKHAAYAAVIRSAVRRAQHVLTVSAYSKHILQETYHLAPERITVAYEAADLLYAGVVRPEVTERFKQLAPYLLYVGNAYPHKNLEGLLHAFKILRTSVQRPLKLICVGKMDYFYQRIRAKAEELGVHDCVVFPGYVSDEELAALYAGALLYVFPSFEEGFGLPPLEAMVAGVPVASSDRSCLPEILGDAAAYFDPASPSAIAGVLTTLIRDERRRRELIQRGHQRVQRYHWDDLARTTLDVYTSRRSHTP